MREMKDSGIEWIGKIPKEWGIVKFKYLHNGLNTGEAIDKEYWESDAGPNAFYTAGLTPIRTGYSNFPTWKETGENDLLLARNGTPYVYLPVSKAYYTDHIIRAAMSRHVNRRFIRYCLQQSIASIVVDSVSIPTWSATLWNNQILTWPSAIEQERIAAFLDAECAEIDAVLEKTRASIEEYKKLKQAVITQAVTKGIRGDRPMKNSGIEWIGDIPAEWDYTKAKNCVDIQNGSDPKTEGSIPVYGSGASSFKTCGEYKEGPSVLIGRKGATLHIPHYISTKFWNVDTAFNVYAKPNFDLKFYFYCACSFDYRFYISQTTLPSMTQTAYENMFLPLPSNDEQRAIASYLDNRCEEIDALIWKKQECLAEIENYKKSLIYEYVTGKKEVHPL